MNKNPRFVTVINDCRDDNAMGRQLTRVASLFDQCTTIGVEVTSDIEAAGNLVDVLDAAEGRPGIILVNVAPRNGLSRQFGNGSPFGFFYYGKTLVISSLGGYTLSLVTKLDIAQSIIGLDLERLAFELGDEVITSRIIGTQFRSFEFLPRIASLLWSHPKVIDPKNSLSDCPKCPRVAWSIDCFGNVKTTLLPGDIDFEDGEEILIYDKHSATCVANGLRDVADGQLALIVGSSGFLDQRLIEIVVSGGSAADRVGVSTIGQDIAFSSFVPTA